MLITSENEKRILTPDKVKILTLSSGGEPLDWVPFSECCRLKAKDLVSWSIGQTSIQVFGGTNSKTGEKTVMNLDSIIALKFSGKKNKGYGSVDYRAHLSNSSLFNRDHHICAYCGVKFPESKLTRDHVIPVSKKGKDIWENVVSACSRCNQRKADKLLETIDMKLLYVPYAPTFHEFLILENRNILFDQMEFLMKGVGKQSRLHEYFDSFKSKQ